MKLSGVRGVLLLGTVLFGLIGSAVSEPVNYGQALTLQKKQDWSGAIQVYQQLIDDLWAKNPNSLILPKSYTGCIYCAMHLGDTDLSLQLLKEMWTSGAWANPNLPASPEFEGYRALLEGRTADAIVELKALADSLQPGTKRWQEAELALAFCHLCVGTKGHGLIAQRIIEQVYAASNDRELVAFSRWMSGVRWLALNDVQKADVEFAQATAADPQFDPSEAMLVILKDQLQPPTDVSGSLADTGSDLTQLLEDYVASWYLVLKGHALRASGDVAGANTLYGQAQQLWSQMNVASASFPAY